MKLPFSRRRVLWIIAVCAWAVAIGFTAGLAESDGPNVAGVQFTWGQVVVLVALGAAWGENRMQVKWLSAQIEELKRELRGER